MTLTTISECMCLQAALILVVLPAWIYDMYWLHDRLMHIIWTIFASSYCFVVTWNTPRIYTFISYDIKYIYGHIVPINFISLNSFSAITCLHTNIHAWLWAYHVVWNVRSFGELKKKTSSNTEWQLHTFMLSRTENKNELK